MSNKRMLRSSLIPRETQFVINPSEGPGDKAGGDYQYFFSNYATPPARTISVSSQSKQKCEAGVGNRGPSKKMKHRKCHTFLTPTEPRSFDAQPRTVYHLRERLR